MEDDIGTHTPDADDQDEQILPTPFNADGKKRGRGSPKRSTGDDGGDDDEVIVPKKKAKVAAKPKADNERQRKSPAKAMIASRPIPRAYEECGEEDKKLMEWRDGGADWAEIRAEWEKMTGQNTGKSTLPNRYARLKINTTVINEEDNAKLLEAKLQVEADFEMQKWDLIVKGVTDRGGNSYTAEVLQRQYKKLMRNANATPPEGVKDRDFVDEDGEE